MRKEILCAQAQQAVDGLKVTGNKTAAKEQIKALYKTFTDSDCTMVEVCTASSIHRGNIHSALRTGLLSGAGTYLCHCSTPLLVRLNRAGYWVRHAGWQDLDTYEFRAAL